MTHLVTFMPKFEIWNFPFEVSYIWNQQSFMLKRKKINLGPRMPYLGVIGLELENANVIMSYLKRAPSNLSEWKVLC